MTGLLTGPDYLRPRSLDEAWRLAAEIPGARFVAGATDLMLRVRDGRVSGAPALISLRSVPELRGIDVSTDAVRIGALNTIRDVLDHEDLCRLFPALGLAARWFAGPQIRNVATVGGNLCNAAPCADTAPPLLVNDARVVLRGSDGERSMPLDEFFVGPGETQLRGGEILAELLVPLPAPTARSTFRRQVRVAMDLTLASVAVLVELDGSRCVRARVAAGSVAPTPVRLCEVEELLAGRQLDEEAIRAAGEVAVTCIAPISDVRASAEYRRRMIAVFVRRALAELATPGRPA